MSDSTIDLYAHAVRRLVKHFAYHPDQLTTEQIEIYRSSGSMC